MICLPKKKFAYRPTNKILVTFQTGLLFFGTPVSHRPLSYAEKGSEVSNVFINFEESSNVNNSDSSNNSQSNLTCKMYENKPRSRLFGGIAKASITSF